MSELDPPPIGNAGHREVEILHDAGDWVAVAKPAGVLVHNSSFAGPRERSLREDVRSALHCDVKPVHRLDRGTSGCVLFSRGPGAVQAIGDALSAPEASKQYVAVVRGHVDAAFIIDHALKDDAGRTLPARTDFTPLAVSQVERCSLLGARIHSGRHHQIRRHLNRAAHPVVGDSSHGDTRFNRAFRARWGFARMALHAWRVSMLWNAERVTLQCPLPPEMADILDRLFGPHWPLPEGQEGDAGPTAADSI